MDQDRVPPGQIRTTNWPVLHYGNVPQIDLRSWRLRVWGRVEAPVEWDHASFMALPSCRARGDIHCVTGWTRLDDEWEGVPFAEVRRRISPLADARHVMVHAAGGWTTNIPLAELERDGVLFAFACNGRPLEPSHGWPLRLVVPQLYFWKSAKWVTGLELLAVERPGFWEQAGYHMHGDPWREERFG